MAKTRDAVGGAAQAWMAGIPIRWEPVTSQSTTPALPSSFKLVTGWTLSGHIFLACVHRNVYSALCSPLVDFDLDTFCCSFSCEIRFPELLEGGAV